MNKLQKQRFMTISLILISLSVATALILYALRQNLNVFLTPSQVATSHPHPTYAMRLGGIVKAGSVLHEQQGLGINFIVTDFKYDIHVRYEGVLPDLFREGKGVITEGKLRRDGVFVASSVLAKHDENYMPKNIYQQLREQAKA